MWLFRNLDWITSSPCRLIKENISVLEWRGPLALSTLMEPVVRSNSWASRLPLTSRSTSPGAFRAPFRVESSPDTTSITALSRLLTKAKVRPASNHLTKFSSDPASTNTQSRNWNLTQCTRLSCRLRTRRARVRAVPLCWIAHLKAVSFSFFSFFNSFDF